MLHITPNLFQFATYTGDMADASNNSPILLFDDKITGVSANDWQEYPAENMLNSSTISVWKSNQITTGTINFTTTGLLDYVSLGAHNLHRIGGSVRLQNSSDNSTWSTVFDWTSVTQGTPLSFIFSETGLTYWKISITSNENARVGILQAGSYLRLPHDVFSGITPIPYSRVYTSTLGTGMTGHFLGNSIIEEHLENDISIEHVDQDWFRTNMTPFVNHSKTRPFVYAWHPQSRPEETMLAWSSSYPSIQNDSSVGTMSLNMSVRGLNDE